MKKRKRKNKVLREIKNIVISLMFVVAIIVFVMSSMQMVIANPYGTIGAIASAGYILLFCWANDVGV